MRVSSINELIPILQIAIGPVILISGVALLLLSMSNRLGSVIDRVRLMCAELRTAPESERPYLVAQLKVLEFRGGLIRQAIIWGSVSVLFVALLIFTLFLTALLHWEAVWLLVSFFTGCLVSMILSLVASIRDVNQSLKAIKMELRAFVSSPPVAGKRG